MTMTNDPTALLGGAEGTYQDPISPSVLTGRPTFEQVVTAIQAECIAAGVPCTERQARQIIGFFQHIVAEWKIDAKWQEAKRQRAIQMGEPQPAEYAYFEWLSDRELMRFHDQLDVIMPDDTIAKLGSAHDLLEHHVLVDRYGDLQLIHSKTDDLKMHCSAGVGVFSQ